VRGGLVAWGRRCVFPVVSFPLRPCRVRFSLFAVIATAMVSLSCEGAWRSLCRWGAALHPVALVVVVPCVRMDVRLALSPVGGVVEGRRSDGWALARRHRVN
jgi:hypothetical protein